MRSKAKTTRLERGLFALLLAVFVSAACGRTSDEESGETHFLSYCTGSCGDGYECLCGACTRVCDSTEGCTALAATASCVAPQNASCTAAAMVCEVECTSNADCAALGSGYRCDAGACRAGTPPDPDAGLVCPAGCFAVMGYPEDASRACADLDLGQVVACQCGTPATRSICQRRVSDDTLWLLLEGAPAVAGEWAPCQGAELERLQGSCDFAECTARPGSFCSAEDTCASRGCGNLQFDGSGCAKPSCTGDQECSSDERCVATSVNTSFCSYSGTGSCDCAGLTVDVSGGFCNAVTEVGPGGVWERLEIDQGAGPCPPEQVCQWTWSVTPDGTVSTMKEGVSATVQLDGSDLADLVSFIDGPELRLGMRDGFPCDQPPTDVGVSMSLVLSGDTLEQDVTGCATTGPEGNVAGQVFSLLRKY
jgi:hypothetical protein